MTRKHHMAKCIWILSGVCLFITTFFSCSYDYFVDENNFWVYVPMIKEQAIPDFYIAFHHEDGRHMRTLRLNGISGNELFLRDGVLRFKLPPGAAYVTCFAQISPMEVSEGLPYTESAISLPVKDAVKGIYLAGKNFRVQRDTIDVLPIGHPDAQKQHTYDITEDKTIGAEITSEFYDLPSSVTRVDIYYSGLATRLNFDGLFAVLTPDDRVLSSYAPLKARANSETFQENLLPSAGWRLDGTAGTMTPLKLDVYFYNGDEVMGHFSDEIFDPVDEEGNVIPGPVYLKPKQKLKFIYKGFAIVSAQLTGWGDIGEGEVTPM